LQHRFIFKKQNISTRVLSQNKIWVRVRCECTSTSVLFTRTRTSTDILFCDKNATRRIIPL